MWCFYNLNSIHYHNSPIIIIVRKLSKKMTFSKMGGTADRKMWIWEIVDLISS